MQFAILGGACYHVINNAICNSNTLTTFILTKVVPNIRGRLPDSVAILLGKAVLWVVYSSVASTYIDDEWRDRIKQDLEETGIATIVDGQNPIMKVPVIVSGNQGLVYIDEIPRKNDVNDTVANADGGNDGANDGNQSLHMRLLDNNRRCTTKLDASIAKWLHELEA
jgi:hypothetical protein